MTEPCRRTFAALAFALALAAGAALAAAILLCKNLVVVSRKFWLSSTVGVVPGAAKRNRVSRRTWPGNVDLVDRKKTQD